eukprot:PITA_14028
MAAALALGWTVQPPLLPPPSPFPKKSLGQFTVIKRPPLLVSPNCPTPTQRLYLTNIDDQLGLRFHVNILMFYPPPCNSSMNGNGRNDPVQVIGEALGKLLVDYYPFAGRLINADDKGKLIMDCTGEGVLLVEAETDISLEDFGDLSPPIPRALEFISNVPGSHTITNSPLLLFQVTRLRCGGFVLGLRFNHSVADGFGIAQFLNSLGEIARGAESPTVPAVWNREILRPRAKPTANYPGLRDYYDFEYKYQERIVPVTAASEEIMSFKSFYFGSTEIAALKRQVEGVRFCTTFQVISACLWQSRTKALKIPADQELTLMFPLNARNRFRPPLPKGYYGNALASAYAQTRARDLTDRPLSYAVKLIKEGDRRVRQEYLRCMIDLAELKGRPLSPSDGSFIVSDVSKVAQAVAESDFGWGKAVYACPVYPAMPHFAYLAPASMKDTEAIVVPICLPSTAMEIFEENLNKTITNGPQR